MAIPCLNKSLYPNLADLTCEIGYTVSGQPILHIQSLLVNHLNECSLDWKIDPLIDFRPYSLYGVVLSSKGAFPQCKAQLKLKYKV